MATPSEKQHVRKVPDTRQITLPVAHAVVELTEPGALIEGRAEETR